LERRRLFARVVQRSRAQDGKRLQIHVFHWLWRCPAPQKAGHLEHDHAGLFRQGFIFVVFFWLSDTKKKMLEIDQVKRARPDELLTHDFCKMNVASRADMRKKLTEIFQAGAIVSAGFG
jgi:hypothetical protein